MLKLFIEIANNTLRDVTFTPLPYEFYRTLMILNAVFAAILMVLYTYQNIYAVMSVFTRKKKYPKAKKLHKYAYVICAHDEEKVVGNLVDSIFKQDYPKDLMKVFVVADNCSDHTADVARNAGAIVFERTSDEKGKSYALDYVIKKLIKDYSDENFEAMFVFDADNLLSKDYTMKMNNLYDHGVKVATSYRESKNFNDSWVSAGASMCFYRECVIVHHSRSLLGIGTYISGTGYYIDFDLVKQMGGWSYHTLVEDIEFSCDCANQGITIGFCEDAVFYDEQPVTFDASVTQRLRWCKGTHQCFYKYGLKKEGRTSFKFTQAKYEMFMHICPLPLISFTWTILFLYLQALYCSSNHLGFGFYFNTVGSAVFWLVASLFGFGLLHAIIVTVKKHKTIDAPLKKQILYCFTFPFYAATFLPLSFIALFKKVTWKKVEHVRAKSIEDMKA